MNEKPKNGTNSAMERSCFLISFKTLVSAAWADNNLYITEKRLLDDFIEKFMPDDVTQEEISEIKNSPLSLSQIKDGIAELTAFDKETLFDLVFHILKSDLVFAKEEG